jgi:CheY-like chemotaxis protein
VKDTGIGIAKDKQHMIFDSFSQADGSTTRQFGGTGLGLSICARIVNMMGSSIEVESALGSGSCFRFQIQVGSGRHSLVRVKSATALSSKTEWPGPLRVLLAEDNPVSRIVAARILETQGHSVYAVKNGQQAIEQIGRERFDVALMDISMPVMDGLAATEIIRKNEAAGEHLPIIAMTAHALAGDRECYLQAGMDGYVAKPLRAEDLLAALQTALGNGRQSAAVGR